MYDAIVVGARVAGSPVAMLLARRGYRVLLVDKATFPSDTMSTHLIQQAGVGQLKRWGLLDRLAATGCPPIVRGGLDLDGFTFPGEPPSAESSEPSYCPRRTVLDKLLVDAAVEAGAELWEGFTLEVVTIDGAQVTGIRGHHQGGVPITETARIVIGADGMHSTVARAIQVPEYNTRSALTCGYYSYWSGTGIDAAGLSTRGRRAILAFPTHDSLVCAAVQWPREEFHEFRRDIEGNLLKTLDLVPAIGDAIRRGKREERLAGTADTRNFFRKPYGPGWALVGDAGYHQDPIMGTGISDAFRDAEFLAEAVDAGFSGPEPLDEALAGYEQRRNQVATPLYDVTCWLASFQPFTPDVMPLFAALGGSQPSAVGSRALELDKPTGSAETDSLPPTPYPLKEATQ
ncbi:MAG: NAD(P)/FAD-dependent oxidoreductase [Dehalococcoidia bacterium]